MSPQDVVILMKIAFNKNNDWKQKLLAESLWLSQSEISKSLARSKYAGLLGESGVVSKRALLDFLHHGIAYVFPVQPGAIARGIPTAHSASPLNNLVSASDDYVWPSAKGHVKGQSIAPLYKNVIHAVQNDPQLHEVLALVDAIRVGRVREKQIAISELKKRLLNAEE